MWRVSVPPIRAGGRTTFTATEAVSEPTRTVSRPRPAALCEAANVVEAPDAVASVPSDAARSTRRRPPSTGCRTGLPRGPRTPVLAADDGDRARLDLQRRRGSSRHRLHLGGGRLPGERGRDRRRARGGVLVVEGDGRRAGGDRQRQRRRPRAGRGGGELPFSELVVSVTGVSRSAGVTTVPVFSCTVSGPATVPAVNVPGGLTNASAGLRPRRERRPLGGERGAVDDRLAPQVLAERAARADARVVGVDRLARVAHRLRQAREDRARLLGEVVDAEAQRVVRRPGEADAVARRARPRRRARASRTPAPRRSPPSGRSRTAVQPYDELHSQAAFASGPYDGTRKARAAALWSAPAFASAERVPEVLHQRVAALLRARAGDRVVAQVAVVLLQPVGDVALDGRVQKSSPGARSAA